MKTEPPRPRLSFAPAAAGTRVRLATTIVFGMMLVVFAAMAVVISFQPMAHPVLALLAAGMGLPVVAAVSYSARIRAYLVTGAALHIVRSLDTVRIPLAGLLSAIVDHEALAGARKLFGNDGVGAIAGRFRSKKLGTFRAYVTDVDRAVVLRWPDRCLVVSPDNPGQFVDAMRSYCVEKGSG